ncbi:hypothetical protein M4L90_07580 [Staphylococcus equorum]|uniref:Uncharacterized protein n=1 Tax=Staphylococcus equorum TaxID=246432 RepID=A0A9X4L4Q1_9STAP|nr:hypothetical protein [Staphylococcus equorum]MDG0819759.1 hypothetical protein [Staphylococcus equorum]MDG0840400.1 hypothetical protein [Staphylococcus equorum]MDG0846083.1 hypothetical protein [Staphylococcus equorum]
MKIIELITIIAMILFTILVAIAVPKFIADKDYIVLIFVSISWGISIYYCFVFFKPENNNN